MASERKFVAENVRRVLLKEYLMKEVSRAGFGGLDVQRTPMGTSVILATERPGLVIGRRGSTIKTLTSVIESRFGFENPQIEVHEVENANLNAQIMAEKLAFSLERGWHFRRAGHSSVRRIMESGAKGCHIIISGKLTGQRHRTEKFKDGYIKFCGDPKLRFMEKGYAVAKLKQGIVGVTVEIMEPDARLPADVTVKNKTDAAAIIESFVKNVPAENTAAEETSADVQEEEKPKKASAKKPKMDAGAEVPAVPAEAKADTEMPAEKPKKASPKKAKKDAAAEVPAEVTADVPAEEKPKKASPKKAKKDAAAEVPAEVTADVQEEEKPKKASAKKKADAEDKPKAKKAAKKEKTEEVSE